MVIYTIITYTIICLPIVYMETIENAFYFITLIGGLLYLWKSNSNDGLLIQNNSTEKQFTALIAMLFLIIEGTFILQNF